MFFIHHSFFQIFSEGTPFFFFLITFHLSTPPEVFVFVDNVKPTTRVCATVLLLLNQRPHLVPNLTHVCLNSYSVCRNWATTGFCTYGDRCNFAHHLPNGMGVPHPTGPVAAPSFTPSPTAAAPGTASATSSFHAPTCLPLFSSFPFFLRRICSWGWCVHSILCAQEPAFVPERDQLRLLQV